jgi:Tol biopolymer transport system component
MSSPSGSNGFVSRESCQLKKSTQRTPRGFSRASILLLLAYATHGFCIPQAEVPSYKVLVDQSKSQSTSLKRPLTMADSIQMTRFGDPVYNDGISSKGLVAKFSPDGKRFVVVLRKGNLESNTNEYSLILFETEEVFRSPNPRVLLSMSSSSNRPAIRNVVWMGDNDTLLFLGENPGETTQVYSFRCSSKELTKLTNHDTSLSSFVVAPFGGEIIFEATNSKVPLFNQNTSRHGFNVTSEWLPDLILGEQGGGGGFDDHGLFLKQAGNEAETKIITDGRVEEYNGMALSPDGLHLVLRTEATHVPEEWTEYDNPTLKESVHAAQDSAAKTDVFQYELIDIPMRTTRLLLDAPTDPDSLSDVVWAPDSKSVVVSNTYLPLNVDDAVEQARRRTHTFLVEVKLSNREVVEISDDDLRLLRWDTHANEVVCDIGMQDSLDGKATKVYFWKNNDAGTWSRATVSKARQTLPDITLDENMSQPPRIFASNPSSGERSLLMDLNPEFQHLKLAKVEEIAWHVSARREVKGGLYWPVDYVLGHKYPLIIQTHGWTPGRFSLDGPFTTAFAAQALAAKGFFVLQATEDLKKEELFLLDTPKEAPWVMAIYDGAIDYLDRRGLIDHDRIGIIGFSRTYWNVVYTLIHSKHHFAAATVADGVDYSYFQYMLLPANDEALAAGFEKVNGAAPFGRGLLKWIKVSPAFGMDKIETPLRIQTLYPTSLLSDWHWLVGLTRLRKPVEMIYIPDGEHVLEKPWDRMISQQGDVDWFCFWLKGEEDPDPSKAEQYSRWINLRELERQGSRSNKTR